MVISLRYLVSIIIFACTSQAYAAIEFVYPGNNTWVGRSGHIILRLNQLDATSIKVSVNGLSSDPIDIGSPEYRKLFQNFFIAQALWDPGVNRIQVDLYNGGQKVDSLSSSIFYAPNITETAPPEFSPVLLHVTDKERLCQSCHILNPTPAQMNSSSEKDNPCYGCHKKMLTSKYVHGPAGTYSCGYCHASKGNPKHSIPKRGASLCYECHADMQSQMKKKTFIHGPVEAGMCDVCHDPHGSQNESQLLKPINELCLSCHGHIATQVHVVRTLNGGGHIVSGKVDPAKKGSGKMMSCISCHNPHGGMVRYFFVNNAEDRMLLCQMCHNK